MLAFGAIIDKNNCVLNNSIIERLNITEKQFEEEKKVQLKKLKTEDKNTISRIKNIIKKYSSCR